MQMSSKTRPQSKKPVKQGAKKVDMNRKVVQKQVPYVQKATPKPTYAVAKERTMTQRTYTSRNATEQNTIKVAANLNTSAYRNVFFALMSYLAQKNIINVNTTNNPQQWQVIYDSLLYLVRQGATNFQGSVASVNELPRVVNNLFKSFLPKQLTYEMGHIAFGFKQFTTAALNLSETIYGHQFGPSYVVVDGGSPYEPAPVYSPVDIADSYSQFLTIIGELAPRGLLRSVAFKSEPLLLDNVSSFARVYSYVGNQLEPFVAGTWLDAELEVPLQCPMLAKFVPYEDQPSAQDPRLPRYLAPSSLDSLSTVGWPLHESFPGYYHKNPALVNQINADEIFTVIALWMAKAKLEAEKAGVPGALSPLPMSQQEFYLILRSALLNVYTSQYYMQFCGDSQWTGTNSNAFLGFFVMPHCSGNTVFGRLQIPTILAENLYALCARSYAMKGQMSAQSFQPVIGRWYRDTLPIINIVNTDGKVIGPLFTTPANENPIDLIDCTYNGQFINVQGTYYQTVLQDWNDEVEKIRAYSAPCQPLMNDSGPKGLLLASTTRLLKVLQLEPGKVDEKDTTRNVVPARLAGCLDFIANKPFESVRAPDGKKVLVRRSSSVKLQADASVLTTTTTAIISKFSLNEEVLGIIELLILPHDRPSNVNDVLTKEQIQVIKREPIGYARDVVTSVQAGTGAGEYSRLDEYANQLITGPAREATTKFQEVFKHLIENGKGGFLAKMLGSVAKTIFPGNENMIDTIADLVPV